MIMRNKIMMLGLLLCTSTIGVVAQEQGQPVRANPQTAYGQWLERDVLYIITPAEKEAFLKLKTDEEREQFVENFWHRRDPDPDTEENEYRDEYYTRIAYANEHFRLPSGVITGWRSDRGKVYIVFGQPAYIEIGNAEFENIKNVPYQKWFYKTISGVAINAEIVFIDPENTNEFRFLKDKKDKILRALSPQPLIPAIVKCTAPDLN
jgi:GWxTD domain-containing protein